jgi:hypothetical protein
MQRSVRGREKLRQPTWNGRGQKSGGAARSRTGLNGFAIRHITALLPRHLLFAQQSHCDLKKESLARVQAFERLERDKRLELSTYTLARYRSTN